jgi:hypothetical protein
MPLGKRTQPAATAVLGGQKSAGLRNELKNGLLLLKYFTRIKSFMKNFKN